MGFPITSGKLIIALFTIISCDTFNKHCLLDSHEMFGTGTIFNRKPCVSSRKHSLCTICWCLVLSELLRSKLSGVGKAIDIKSKEIKLRHPQQTARIVYITPFLCSSQLYFVTKLSSVKFSLSNLSCLNRRPFDQFSFQFSLWFALYQFDHCFQVLLFCVFFVVFPILLYFSSFSLFSSLVSFQ